MDKNPFVLSVCLTEEDNYGVLQYRTILWKRMVGPLVGQTLPSDAESLLDNPTVFFAGK